MDSLPPPLSTFVEEPLMFPISLALLAGMYFLSSWLHAQIGWAAMAKRYRTKQAPPKNLKRCYALVNSYARYNNLLQICFLPEGVFLSVFLFHFGHPPLLLPWSEIHYTKKVWGWEKFSIGNPTIATISLDKAMAQQLQDAMKLYSNK